jgi:hypothetical protein
VAACRARYGRHHLQLAAHIGLAEPHPGDAVVLREGGHCPPEPLAELLEQRRRGEWVAQVAGQERHHLRAGLQLGHVGIEVNAIQALDIQSNMPIQNLGHGDDPLRHDDHLATEDAAATAPPPQPLHVRGAAAIP